MSFIVLNLVREFIFKIQNVKNVFSFKSIVTHMQNSLEFDFLSKWCGTYWKNPNFFSSKGHKLWPLERPFDDRKESSAWTTVNYDFPTFWVLVPNPAGRFLAPDQTLVNYIFFRSIFQGVTIKAAKMVFWALSYAS